jgi:Protein of unknown function (DUF998)
MGTLVLSRIRSNVSTPAARLATGSALATILLLAGLHALSPEFDPSWRVVSEYANGKYGYVLSLMFGAWALSNWSLAFALWPRVETWAGRIGLYLLLASGVGEAMASIFDINHPLHDLAGAIGVPTLPIAASLISVSLGRVRPSLAPAARKSLLWTSNLIWISLVLFVATMIILIVTLHHAGGHMSSHLTQLPPGVIALDGWANRLYVVSCCMWVITAAKPEFRWKSGL